MSTLKTDPNTPLVAEAVAVDANRIVTEIFPDFSLRSWRRWDTAQKCPRGFTVGGRKVWRVSDLKQWAEWGFPDRATFEARLRAENGGGKKHVG
jgi:hypothetical protein